MTYILMTYLGDMVQSVLFVGFLYLFFGKSKNRELSIAAFVATAVILFAVTYYFSFGAFPELSYLEAVISLAVLLIYSVVFLRGNIALRILMPITAYGLFAFLEWLVSFALIGFRYRDTIDMLGDFEQWSFFSPLAGKLISLVSLAVLALIFFLLLMKRGKDNRLKTELLLSRQREEMYQQSVLESNQRIEKMSEIKHDMQNNLSAISTLVSSGRYDEAMNLCHEADDILAAVITPIHTDNPTLNAILNVETEKARANDIRFVYNISDSLRFVSAADIVSIIGNLCDNAVDYLKHQDKAVRKMSLDVYVRNEYHFISCRNAIADSVLSANPQLLTAKEDKATHGKGIQILKSVAAKYDGELRIDEKENAFNATVIILDKN